MATKQTIVLIIAILVMLAGLFIVFVRLSLNWGGNM